MNNYFQIRTDYLTGLASFKEKLLQEGMFEKSHKNSYFLKLYQTPSDEIQGKYTTSMAFNSRNELMAVLIFEHINHDLSQFQFKGQKIKFQTIGRLMIYVKPEFRKNGIAQKLILNFNEKLKNFIKSNYSQTNDIFFVVNALQKAYSLSVPYLSEFVISETFNNFHVNKDSVKSSIYYHRKQPTWRT